MLCSYVVFGGTFMLRKAQEEASKSQGTLEQWFKLRQIWYPNFRLCPVRSCNLSHSDQSAYANSVI